jgi:hypothetical protein
MFFFNLKHSTSRALGVKPKRDGTITSRYPLPLFVIVVVNCYAAVALNAYQ